MEILEKNKTLSQILWFSRESFHLGPFGERFDTYVRRNLVSDRYVRAVFFDLQKAYDTACKHGILIDLHEAGFRGQLPQFISRFLKHRVFKVKLGQVFSSQRPQCAGITQGSTLIVTFFALRIN